MQKVLADHTAPLGLCEGSRSFQGWTHVLQAPMLPPSAHSVPRGSRPPGDQIQMFFTLQSRYLCTAFRLSCSLSLDTPALDPSPFPAPSPTFVLSLPHCPLQLVPSSLLPISVLTFQLLSASAPFFSALSGLTQVSQTHMYFKRLRTNSGRLMERALPDWRPQASLATFGG